MSKQAEIQRHERQEFAAPGSSFDRFIGFMRIALPVGVGIILAILAISPVESHNEFSFLLDRNQVDEADEGMRLAGALYRGEDKQGRPFSLRARTARQRSSDEPLLDVESMQADFSVGDGRATAAAQRGEYDLDRELMHISGPLQFSRDNGDTLTASNVLLDINDKLIRSDPGRGRNDVSGRAAFGDYRAGSLLARLADRRLILGGGVRGTTDFGSYSANSLLYDFNSGDVVLTGNARLRID